MKKDALPPADDRVLLRPLMSVETVAAALELRPGAIYRMLYSGQLPFVKVGKYLRIKQESLLAIYDTEERRPVRPARRTVPADKALKLVLTALERLGQMSYADLALKTKISNWSLSAALARLMDNGKVTRSGAGRKGSPFVYRLLGGSK